MTRSASSSSWHLVGDRGDLEAMRQQNLRAQVLEQLGRPHEGLAAGKASDPPAVAAWDRPWDTKPVLPGRRVLWELWAVLSVLVERDEQFRGALVMRRSWVRFPQAAPTFPQVNGPFRESPRFCSLPNVGQMCALLRCPRAQMVSLTLQLSRPVSSA
jgi:hypothetical protein